MESSSINFEILNTIFLQIDIFNPTFTIIIGLLTFIFIIFKILFKGLENILFGLGTENNNYESPIEPQETLLSNPKLLLATTTFFNKICSVLIAILITIILVNYLRLNNLYINILNISFTNIILLFICDFIALKTISESNTRNGILFNLLKISTLTFKPFASILAPQSLLNANNLSQDDVNRVIEITSDENTTLNDKNLLKEVVNFRNTSVKQIMTVRTDITALDKSLTFIEVIEQVKKLEYSRIPVFEDNIDKLIGILHLKDLLPYIHLQDFEWNSLVRQCYYIPENKKIDVLLKDFQAKHIHMAIIIDEYGTTAGLITLEDVIEEIVGEINDEFDDINTENFKQLSENEYIIEAKISLNDFYKIFNLSDEEISNFNFESDSFAGMLLEIKGGLPKTGELLFFHQFEFEIISADKRRIKSVKVKISKDNETE